jgi:predicted nucleic acid-binding protein
VSVIDASVWVSRFLNDDTFHNISRSWLLETVASGQPLVGPTIVLAEVSGAIARRTGDTQFGYQIVHQIQQIPTLQPITVDVTLGQLAAQIASERRLRGADAVYVAVAKQLDLPLITWDRELLNRVAGLVIARTPGIDK